MSYGDKHDSHPIKLQQKLAPSLAQDFANKLLPTVLHVACYPSLACIAVGPMNRVGRPTNSTNVYMTWNIYKEETNCCFHLVFTQRTILCLDCYLPPQLVRVLPCIFFICYVFWVKQMMHSNNTAVIPLMRNRYKFFLRC